MIVGLAGPLFCAGPALGNPTVPAAPTAPPAPPDGVVVPVEWLLWIWTAIVLVILWMGDVIRPGSPERHPKRDVSGHPAIVWLLAGIVTFASVSFGAGVTSAAAELLGAAPDGDLARNALLQAGGYAAGVLIGGLIIYLLASGSGDAGLRFRGADIPLGVGWLLLTYPLVMAAGVVGGLVHLLITGDMPHEVAHDMLRQIIAEPGNPWVWMLMVVAVVGAPVLEELVYRVCLQSAVLRVVRKRWPAVLLTAIIFALTHRIGGTVPWHAIPALFTLGLVMGVVYERTGRLGVPIVMHAAFNLGNIVMAVGLAD